MPNWIEIINVLIEIFISVKEKIASKSSVSLNNLCQFLLRKRLLPGVSKIQFESTFLSNDKMRYFKEGRDAHVGVHSGQVLLGGLKHPNGERVRRCHATKNEKQIMKTPL